MTGGLQNVIDFFPTGTAEGDREILDRVFVYAAEFARVINPPRSSPHLLLGTKGSGKTAVVDFSRKLLDSQGVPNVLLAPFDIETSHMGENDSTGDLARLFYYAILDAIAARLSQDNSGWFSDDYATLYRHSVGNGQRPPDFATKFGSFLGEIAKPIIETDMNKAFPHLVATTRSEVGDAVRRIVGKKGFYLFIDDTDQVARPGVKGHLNRVWALLLAVRRLTYDMQDLRAVISLRTEVWNRLQRDDYGQRDQTDHFRQLVVKMHSSREHVGKIVDRRLALAAAQAGAQTDGYQAFFDGPDARAPMSADRRLWRDLIVVRSRERPRDAIQLVNELAQKAISRGLERIDEGVFQSVMPPFSKAIAEQFAEECRPEFPEAMEFIRSLAEVDFTEGGFTMTAETAKDHFRRMLSRFGATLHGSSLNQNSPDSPFAIWRYFFQAGLLNARVSDASKKSGFRHLDPNDDPHLVSKTRWNELQSMLWEVNAVYRDFLIEVQEERSLNLGLPKKPKGHGKRY